MEFYPLNKSFFANASVTSSFAVSSSFIVNAVPTASHALFPTGSKGPQGNSCGQIYLLSSSLMVCGTTTTTTTAAPTTTTAAPPTTTTTTSGPTTTTTTAAITCSGFCNPQATPSGCGKFCTCQSLEPGNPYSEVGRCVTPTTTTEPPTTTTTTVACSGIGVSCPESNGSPSPTCCSGYCCGGVCATDPC